MDEIESGDLESPSPTEQASALVAFVRVIGLRAGDVQRLSLFNLTGALISESKAEPLDRNKAQWMMFTGLRRPASGWQRGSYRARYVIERGGNVALQHAFAVELRP